MTDGEDSRRAEEGAENGGRPALAIGFYLSAILLIFGTILVLYGILGPASQARKSLGFDINLWWGLFMVVFGCVVLGLTLASPRRRAARREG